MKTIAKRIICIALVVVLIICGLFVNGNIGISEKKIVSDIRNMQYIDDSWAIEGNATDDMAAYICYPEDKSDFVFSVYLNHPGLSFGYFFRYGGALAAIEEGILELEPQLDEYEASAYISMNTKKAEKLKIDNGTEIKAIDIDSQKPFAIVLPADAGAISFYDVDGNLIECVKETM